MPCSGAPRPGGSRPPGAGRGGRRRPAAGAGAGCPGRRRAVAGARRRGLVSDKLGGGGGERRGEGGARRGGPRDEREAADAELNAGLERLKREGAEKRAALLRAGEVGPLGAPGARAEKPLTAADVMQQTYEAEKAKAARRRRPRKSALGAPPMDADPAAEVEELPFGQATIFVWIATFLVGIALFYTVAFQGTSALVYLIGSQVKKGQPPPAAPAAEPGAEQLSDFQASQVAAIREYEDKFNEYAAANGRAADSFAGALGEAAGKAAPAPAGEGAAPPEEDPLR